MAETDFPVWRIERLSASHDRTSFCCGQPALDEFLQRLATQYDKKDMGRTYVAVVPGQTQVQGYYTLSTGAVAFQDVPAEVSRKLPRHPIPVAHLRRLAVDQSAQGKKLGKALLLDALRRCLQFSEEIGMFAVEVIALGQSARAFYLKFGFTPLADDPLHLYRPTKKLRKLWTSGS